MTFDDDFWPECPRKIGKGAARKAFEKACKHTPAEQIIEGMKNFARECAGKETQFIPHPATWLNQERWDDEQEDETQTSRYHRDMASLSARNPAPIAIRIYSEELLPEIMDKWRRSGNRHWWHVAARKKQAQKFAMLKARAECGSVTPETLENAERVYNTGKLPDDLRELAEWQEEVLGDPAKRTGD